MWLHSGKNVIPTANALSWTECSDRSDAILHEMKFQFRVHSWWSLRMQLSTIESVSNTHRPKRVATIYCVSQRADENGRV